MRVVRTISQFPEMNKFYTERFRERDAERIEITGDHDARLEAPIDAERDAFDALIEVVQSAVLVSPRG